MRVLGIETSCDETGVAVYDSQAGLLAHRLHSQVALHAEFGGVVPELASRDHIRRILPLIREVIAAAGLQGRSPPVDGVAYTAGPGLVGALLVGGAVGRSLALAWGIPAIGVHHMEGHLLAPWMETPDLAFPVVALLVSGGHTMLVQVAGVGCYTLLGESLDDAVGEVFDKTAKMLGLGYPGGPALEKLAATGVAGRFKLPRPMLNRPGLDFSFSGLKTAVRVALARARSADAESATLAADLAAEFQAAVVDTLAAKCRRALIETGASRLVIAGGVGANRAIRARLEQETRKLGARLYCPRLEFCTDNGAMIAYAGMLRLQAGATEGTEILARPRWSLESLAPLNPTSAENT